MLLLSLLSLLSVVAAAFVSSQSCLDPREPQILDKFVIDVAINETDKVMKFLVNTRANPDVNTSDKLDGAAFVDVNPVTNTYTTLYVEMDFMGKQFFNTSLRFCDLLAIKNTTDATRDPRLPGYQPHLGSPIVGSNVTSGSINSRRHFEHQNPDDFSMPVPYGFSGGFPTTLLDKNVTLAGYFANETGDVLRCPVYPGDSLFFYYEVDIAKHVHKLGSYQVKFFVLAPGTEPNESGIIGCSRIYVTPIQPSEISDSIFYATIAVLIVTALVNVFIIVNSSFQESSNPFLYRASTICNTRLLKQLDADITRIIIYLQFALFLGGLDLKYPGFFQPFISQIRWCALIGAQFFSSHRGDSNEGVVIPANRESKMDNIYITFNSGGLRSLTSFSWGRSVFDIWPNFMIVLAIWLVIEGALEEMFLGVKYLVDKVVRRVYPRVTHVNGASYTFTWRKNCYFLVGQFYHSVLVLFGVPFLTLTTYLFFVTAGSTGRNFDRMPTMDEIFDSAFASNGSYADLDAQMCSSFSNSGEPSDVVQSCPNSNATQPVMNKNHHHGVPREAMVSLVLASICFFLWIVTAAYFIFRYLFTIRRWMLAVNQRTNRLYTQMKSILLWAFYYHHYRPECAQYVALDIIFMVAKSCVMGAIQGNGKVQVILLVILEVVDLLALFALRPYYAPMSWYSTRWVLPVCRAIVTVLNITYIHELDISEANRTYVAYTQLFVHLFVAVVFILNLCWCFGATVVSIAREKTMDDAGDVSDTGSNYDGDFKYKPVVYSQHEATSSEENIPKRLSNPISAYGHWRKVSSNASKSLSNRASTLQRTASDIEDDETEGFDFYFRGKSQNNAQLSESVCSHDNSSECDSLPDSFTAQQHDSNLRKKRTDYRVREGDRVYNKYFVDDAIDSEVKELWESRFNNPKKLADPQRFLKRAGTYIRRRPSQEHRKEFTVSRPRPLVVKTMAQINEERMATPVSKPEGADPS
ncbi:hypothetical protein DICA3_B01948 [Diutina catenulata]